MSESNGHSEAQRLGEEGLSHQTDAQTEGPDRRTDRGPLTGQHATRVHTLTVQLGKSTQPPRASGFLTSTVERTVIQVPQRGYKAGQRAGRASGTEQGVDKWNAIKYSNNIII